MAKEKSLTIKVRNFLSGEQREFILVAERILKVVDDSYALTIYPVDNGDFSLWAEPVLLFKEGALADKQQENQQVQARLIKNQNELQQSVISDNEKSRLGFEYFGDYQAMANNRYMLDQWGLTNDELNKLLLSLSNWGIAVLPAK